MSLARRGGQRRGVGFWKNKFKGTKIAILVAEMGPTDLFILAQGVRPWNFLHRPHGSPQQHSSLSGPWPAGQKLGGQARMRMEEAVPLTALRTSLLRGWELSPGRPTLMT